MPVLPATGTAPHQALPLGAGQIRGLPAHAANRCVADPARTYWIECLCHGRSFQPSCARRVGRKIS